MVKKLFNFIKIKNNNMSKDKKNNTGVENTGEYNSGNWNSGNWNSGDWNSGNWNSGDRNSGDRNSGDSNSGYRNSGNWNSGYRNSGYRNSGCFNSTQHSSGIFNNQEAKILSFNKHCDWTMGDFYNSKAWNALCKMEVTQWISESEMNNDEKKANPSFYTTGGYLKIIPYKEACIKMWDNLNKTERKEVMNLPNFDAEIFFDITGIDVREKEKPTCDGKVVEIDGKKYKLTELK